MFRGHKSKFQESGPKHICDACGQGISSGTMVTAEPFHYHESCCKCQKCEIDLNGEYYKRNNVGQNFVFYCLSDLKKKKNTRVFCVSSATSLLVLCVTTRFAQVKVLCDTQKSGRTANVSIATSARQSSALTNSSWWTTSRHVRIVEHIWIQTKNKIGSSVDLLF